LGRKRDAGTASAAEMQSLLRYWSDRNVVVNKQSTGEARALVFNEWADDRENTRVLANHRYSLLTPLTSRAIGRLIL
jgi:hypothetical protein